MNVSQGSSHWRTNFEYFLISVGQHDLISEQTRTDHIEAWGHWAVFNSKIFQFFKTSVALIFFRFLSKSKLVYFVYFKDVTFYWL